MKDRKKVWSILLAMTMTYSSIGQSVHYYFNGEPLNEFNSNQQKLTLLEAEFAMPDLAKEFDKVEFILQKEGVRTQTISTVSYSRLQYKSLGTDTLRFLVLGLDNEGSYQTQFPGLTNKKLIKNWEEISQFSIKAVGYEVTGTKSHWHCSDYCYTECYQTCSGGYMETKNTYGNAVRMDRQFGFKIVQHKSWLEDKEAYQKQQEEEELREKKRQEEREDIYRRKKLGRSLLYSAACVGIIAWVVNRIRNGE